MGSTYFPCTEYDMNKGLQEINGSSFHPRLPKIGYMFVRYLANIIKPVEVPVGILSCDQCAHCWRITSKNCPRHTERIVVEDVPVLESMPDNTFVSETIPRRSTRARKQTEFYYGY
jgi:hypothetical protein